MAEGPYMVLGRGETYTEGHECNCEFCEYQGEGSSWENWNERQAKAVSPWGPWLASEIGDRASRELVAENHERGFRYWQSDETVIGWRYGAILNRCKVLIGRG